MAARRAWPVLVVLMPWVAACHRAAPTPAGEVAHANLPGTLPSGCSVVAAVVPGASAAVGELVDALVSTQMEILRRLPGVDLRRDVTQITLCKFDVMQGAPGFVMLLSGGPVGATFAAAMARDQTWERGTIAGVDVAGRPHLWSALRSGDGGGVRELVLASDKELLRLTLAGPSGGYQLDPASPFSAIVSGQALAALRSAQADGRPTGLEAVREVRFSLLPDASALTLRMILADRTVADRLAKALVPLLDRVAQKMTTPDGRPPEVSAQNSGGDVVAMMGLPMGSLHNLVASIGSRRAAGRRALP